MKKEKKYEKEIQNIVSNTAKSKAVGFTSVPTFLLKQFKKELAVPLSLIINLSFKTLIFHQVCKVANVIIIYGKGDQLDCSDYRPISQQLNIGKIIEKCMHHRLYKFLNKENIFIQNCLVLETFTLHRCPH